MPETESRNLYDRLRTMPGRTKLFLATGVVLLVLVFVFKGCSGVEIEEEEAVAAARAEIDFEPERTEARVLRQGIGAQPVWMVVFTVRDPEGGREDFLHHAAVEVDVRTGEVLEVNVIKSDRG